MLVLFGKVCCVWMLFECWAVGDPQFWINIRLAANPERAAEFVETYLANANVPKASDVERWPASSGEADDSQKRRNEVLTSTLAKTEIMVLNFYQEGHLSLRMGKRSWTHRNIHNSVSRICRVPPSFSFFGNLSNPSRNAWWLSTIYGCLGIETRSWIW